MRRAGLSSIFVACLVLVAARADEPRVEVLLQDDFSGPLDPARWEPVRVHDVRQDQVATRDGQLVLGLDTLGSDDATVKLRGLRSRESFVVEPGSTLRTSVTIDWNDPANGCYLTAGLALVPDDVLDPRAADEALAFEWVGVPPGKNVRPSLWQRTKGGLRPLYTEGWPQALREDRFGRHVRRSRITLEVTGARVRLVEDEVERFAGDGAPAGRVRLVLFLTGHSNYPERSVLMDDVRVERVAE